MLYLHSLELLLLLYPTIHAATLQASREANTTLTHGRVNLSSLFSPSSPLVNAPYDEWISSCDASSYGSNLNIDSCLQVFLEMSVSSTTDTYRLRNDWLPVDRKLPIMFVSDDGLCIVQPKLKEGARYARAAGLHIAGAARRLIDDCKVDDRLQGGVASEIGGDNRLNIVLRSYSPKDILCWGRDVGPSFDSCNRLLLDMDTRTDPQLFKQYGDPGVAEPLVIESRDKKCRLVVRIEGDGVDSASMYDIWEAAYMVNQRCVKKGQKGAHVNIGKGKSLYINLFPQDAHAAGPNGIVHTIA